MKKEIKIKDVLSRELDKNPSTFVEEEFISAPKWEKRFYKFYDKLFNLIEEEIVLATGNKSKEHFSGDCRINDIMELVKKQIKGERQRIIEEIFRLLREELNNFAGVDYEKETISFEFTVDQIEKVFNKILTKLRPK